jgi:hypothetical protein
MRQIRMILLACFVVAVSIRPAVGQEASLAPSSAQAAVRESVPRLVQFGAVLKDVAGRPIGGVASVTFAVYAEQAGGAPLWAETQNVLADANGHYNVTLGAATSAGFPAELFGTGESRWLGVTVARAAEMPRVLLASVPYALKAGDAQTLGGLPASAYVTTQQFAARGATGTTILSAGGVAASQAAPEGVPAAQVAQGADATPQTAAGPVTGAGTAHYVPLWTADSNLGNSKIFQSVGGNLGINTTTPSLLLDVNGNSVFRGSVQLTPQGIATPSAGQPSHTLQWQASVWIPSQQAPTTLAYSFRSVPALNGNTDLPQANLDLFYGPAGGTLKDTGLAIDPTGTIIANDFNVQTIDLPNSQGSQAGTIRIGGVPFLADFGGYQNVDVGYRAGSNDQGGANTALGAFALSFNTVGSDNTAVGYDALYRNISGDANVAVGTTALPKATTANQNTAVGYIALEQLTTGGSNVAIGYATGEGLTTGSGNTLIGSNTNVGPATMNSTAIGINASATADNVIVLGATGANAPAVGIGTSAPGHTLDVVDSGLGGAAIFASSNVAYDSAIYGWNTATTGVSNGGYFTTASPSGNGVVAINQGGGNAASFYGNVQITGTLTKGGGSFKIDDPIDPAGKYLSHSFVESPDMKNIYDGNVTTDAHGYATITLPPYFEALNRDFRYQLTTFGVFSQAIVAREIKDGKFTVRTSKPHVKVSWQVTGIRHDAWANANRIPNEEEKPANEQGKYLHPELFGAGPEKSVIATAPSASNSAAAPTVESAMTLNKH